MAPGEKSSQSGRIRGGEELALFEAFDDQLRERAKEWGADERQYPVLMDHRVLSRAGYPDAFPHLLMLASHLSDPAQKSEKLLCQENLAEPQWALSPAVCYHVYAEFAEKTIAKPLVITTRNRCFRHEDSYQAELRELEFEMREIVLLGSASEVEKGASEGRGLIERIAADAGITAKWEIGEDPFFLPVAEGKAFMQRLRETKWEFVSDDESRIPLASINRHGTFFGERFSITDADGNPIHTACVAFGLDRWHSKRSRK